MNITMNIDCSPEEARRLMGLPDLQPIHDIFLSKVKETMTEGLTPDAVERMMRAWSPMGDAGMAAWRQMLENLSGTGRS